ncbi:MAG: 50S ribosomal protein L10 [Christensenellales bacterium]|jgi:large subunit ribosomal protein L10
MAKFPTSENYKNKIGIVEDIADKFQRAKCAVLMDYRGLTVQQANDLRTKCREAGVEYKVLKNRMIKLAMQNIGIDALDAYLEGPTSVAFSYDDVVAPAKIMADYIKSANVMQIKAGVLGTDVLDAQAVDALAKLPSKEMLVGKLLGTMSAPLTKLVGVLNNPARGLVVALKAIGEQKSA